MNILDDFIENYKIYNKNAIINLIKRIPKLHNTKTGDIDIFIEEPIEGKELKDVIQFCIDNPQPKEKISEAIDLMVPGWERAKMMDIDDELI